MCGWKDWGIPREMPGLANYWMEIYIPKPFITKEESLALDRNILSPDGLYSVARSN